MTSGLFYYDSKITQRGDFYDSLCTLNQPCDSRYANPAFGTAAAPIPYGAIDPGLAFLDGLPQMQLFSAKQFGLSPSTAAHRRPGTAFRDCFPEARDVRTTAWVKSRPSATAVGRATPTVTWRTRTRSCRRRTCSTRRDRSANSYRRVHARRVHVQRAFALTLGARWARDQLTGEENLAYYAETSVVPLGFNAAAGTAV